MEQVFLNSRQENGTFSIINKVNLVPSVSFCYLRKAKKMPWNTLDMWLKPSQIEGIFFKYVDDGAGNINIVTAISLSI